MDKYFKRMDSLEPDLDDLDKAEEKPMSSYFRPMDSLDSDLEDLAQTEEKTMSKYFRPMDSLESDLDDLAQATEKSSSSYFMPAGDLDSDLEELAQADEKNSSSYFMPAGDLDINNNSNSNSNSNSKLDEINDYLITVVSGEKYPAVCELGVLMGSARMVINLEQLKELVDSGHNIVSARVINADREMIEVEVQKYKYDKDMMERRSRF